MSVLEFLWPRMVPAALRRAGLGVALALVLAAGPLAPRPAAAQGAAAADVTATQEKGFGRIVIAFRDRSLLPQYSTRVNNGVLVVQFGEPVSIDVDRVPSALAQYVTIARRDPDGQGLRLALARQVKVNTLEAGERLYIDLLPPSWAGPPPTLPDGVVAELAKRAEAALKAQRETEKKRFGVKVLPKVDFRVGRQPTFTRFSFGWNIPFDTTMSRDADTVTLTFSRLADIDFSPVVADPPAALREIQAEPDGDRLKVILKIAPEADVRAFREEQTYVVDLTAGAKAASGPEAAVRKALDADGDKARAVVSAPGAVPLPASAPEAAAKPGAAKPKAAAAQATAVPAMPETAGPVAGRESALPADSDNTGPAQAPPSPPEAVGEGRPDPAGPRQADVKIVRVEAKRIGNVVRLSFPFPSRVAGAAFKRDDSLWIVFDSAMPMDLRAIGAVLGPVARDVASNRTERGQTIRIQLAEPMLTTLGADGNSWILSIGEMVLEPARPLAVRREFRGPNQGVLKIDLPDAGTVHEINDPATGDKLFAVTAFGPPRGLLKTYGFAELETLPSAHGVAIVPRIDDLKVGLELGSVVMTRERGLTLSTGSGGSSSLELPKVERRAPRRAVDPSTFDIHDAGGFVERVRALTERIADSADLKKTDARFDLAEFYVSRRFAPEALGVLRLIAAEEPGIERDPGFIVMFGAAQALTGRYLPARQALGRAEVADNADAAMWRTIAAAGDQKWDEAREAAVKGAGAVGAYPPDIRALFDLAAAEAAIELNDFGTGQSRLAAVEPGEIANDLRARYDLLQARIADAAGRPEDAMERLDRVAASSDRRAAAEAEYRRLRVLVRDGKIEAAEAIERLKSLSFTWRGDEIELKSLRFLANLQAEHGLFRDAFMAMRTAIQVDPDAETTRLLQDDMGREFVSLYLDDKADRLKPVEALALYYDFRELTPIGRLGDEIVRKLADRLVGVDLLDQASELLNYQIDNRLRGVARAQIAADLAVVALLDHKPDKALAVLNKTRQSQLPASVERQRRLVEARALSEAGRTDVALEMINGMTGSEVDRLRADILWKNKRWRDAGERLEAMLGGRWSEGPALDDQERQDVLRAAVAFTLANDDVSLGRLRAKFAERMRNSPNAAAFAVVTAPIQSQGNEFRTIAKEIASVDTMRSFLDEYRSQYMKSNGRQPDAATPPAGAPGQAPGPAAAAAGATKMAAAEPDAAAAR